VIEPGGEFLRHRYVADQHQYGVLALDFASVDAALDEDDGLVSLGRGLGRKRAVVADNERDERTALGRCADVEHLDEARRALQAARDLDALGVWPGLLPTGFFAGGEKIGRRRLGARGERCCGPGRRWLECRVRGDRSLSESQRGNRA
jgi:hypothetical protein